MIYHVPLTIPTHLIPKMKHTLVLLSASLALLVVASCSSTLSENPPKSVTDPAAVALYQQAKEGDIKALRSVANCYERGYYGFPVNRRKAVDCYENAANLGDMLSQRRTGYAYLNGEGRFESESSARKYFEMAFAQGDNESGRMIDKIEERIAEREKAAAQRLYNKKMQEARGANTLLNSMFL